MSGYRLFAAIVLLAFVQPASAQEPDAARLEAMVHINKLVNTAKSVDLLGSDLRRFFRRNDYDGGGISAGERGFQRNKLIAMHRSIRIMGYLSADFDGDGIVSADEWNRALRAIAHDKLLRRREDRTSPTESEIEAEMRTFEERFREKYGDPDANDDGNFTYEEILEGANATLPHPNDPRLKKGISGAFDRDGDDIVSEVEYMDAIIPIIAGIDSDGDGTFSKGEIAAFHTEAETARRELKALRDAKAEAMGFGPERRLPGLAWP